MVDAELGYAPASPTPPPSFVSIPTVISGLGDFRQNSTSKKGARLTLDMKRSFGKAGKKVD